MYQSGRAGDEAKKRKSPAKSGRVGIYGYMKSLFTLRVAQYIHCTVNIEIRLFYVFKWSLRGLACQQVGSLMRGALFDSFQLQAPTPNILVLLQHFWNRSLLQEVVITLGWYSVIDFTSILVVNHVESLSVNQQTTTLCTYMLPSKDRCTACVCKVLFLDFED